MFLGKRRLQFSLKVLLAGIVIVGVLCAVVLRDSLLYERYDHSLFTTTADGFHWMVHYGYRDHRFLAGRDVLEYAVFSRGRRDMEGVVMVYLDSDGRRVAIVSDPQPNMVMLPQTGQLFDYVDERFKQSSRRVAKRQLDAFLASQPSRYTVRDLLEYARAHP